MPRKGGVNVVNDEGRAIALRDELMPMNPTAEGTDKLHIREACCVHLNDAGDPSDRDNAEPNAKCYFIAYLQRAGRRKQFHSHKERREGDKVDRVAMKRRHEGDGC